MSQSSATALKSSVNSLIDDFGNAMTYYPPAAGTYNYEGDWTATYQASTTVASYWIRSNLNDTRDYTEMGLYPLKENEAIIKADIAPVLRAKVVENSVQWEITEVRPVRISDVDIVYIVNTKNMLP